MKVEDERRKARGKKNKGRSSIQHIERDTRAATTLTSDEEPNVLPRKAKGRPCASKPETCDKGEEGEVMEWRASENVVQRKRDGGRNTDQFVVFAGHKRGVSRAARCKEADFLE